MLSKEPKQVSYEEMIARLEALVSALEGGTLSLEEAMNAYKEALTLSEACSKLLDTFQGEVLLVQDGKETPFDASEV